MFSSNISAFLNPILSINAITSSYNGEFSLYWVNDTSNNIPLALLHSWIPPEIISSSEPCVSIFIKSNSELFLN